jgi:multiple sugar transport system substrate-binding protein
MTPSTLLHRGQRWLAWLLVAATLLGACRGAGSPPAGQGAASGRPVSFIMFGDPAELRAYQALVAAYEARYPGAKIELIHVPDQADFRKRLATDYAAGTPADVVLLNYRRMAGFAAKGLLWPVEQHLAASTVISASDFYPQAMRAFRWRREQLCLPQNISSLAVFYNKAMFDRAGVPYPGDTWSWDDMLQAAKALTRDVDGDGGADEYGLGIEPSLIRLAPFVWQSQGDLVFDLVRPSSLALSTTQALKAVQWFVDLQVLHHVVPGAVAEEAQNSEDRFLNGTLAMFFNSRRGVPTYREITAFDWDVAPLPANRGRRTNVLHSDAYCISAAAPDKEAAWRFVEFANSPEGQTIVAAAGRTVPSLIAVAESPVFLDPNAKPSRNQVFLDAIPFLRTLPIVENWADVEEIVGDELERAFYGQATAAEAMASAVLRTEEYFVLEPPP